MSDEERPCPVCGELKGRVALRGSDHREGLGGDFAVLVCADCGLGRTQPMPDDLDAWYPASYQQHVADGLTARVVNRAIRIGAGGRKLVPRLVPDAELGGPVAPGARVLDVGAGNGNAVRALAAVGANAHGVEPDEGGVAAAGQAGCHTVEHGTLEHSALRNQHWDLIRFFHVVEHLPDPVATLSVARGCLADGGRLVVAVPNFGSAGRRLFRRSWDGLELPRHLQHFTSGSLRRTLDAAGFDVESLRTTPLFGVLPGSLDAYTSGGQRQRGWGNALPVRALAYPVEVALATLGLGDGLVAVARAKA